jgi:hypothetical protein
MCDTFKVYKYRFLVLLLCNNQWNLAIASTAQEEYPVGYLVRILVLCSILCSLCIVYHKCCRDVESLNDPSIITEPQSNIESPGDLPNSRSEQFANNFHFQKVLSNNGDRDQGEDSGCDDDDSIIHVAENSEGPTTSVFSLQFLRKFMLSTWRRPERKDECCICLDGYHVDETICTYRKEGCKHVFHKECIVEWLKDHDHCPLCRTDLMN